MKLAIFISLAVVTLAAVETSILKNKFGSVEYLTEDETQRHKQIFFPDDSIYYDNWRRV
jgi:hypothetical protein